MEKATELQAHLDINGDVFWGIILQQGRIHSVTLRDNARVGRTLFPGRSLLARSVMLPVSLNGTRIGGRGGEDGGANERERYPSQWEGGRASAQRVASTVPANRTKDGDYS